MTTADRDSLAATPPASPRTRRAAPASTAAAPLRAAIRRVFESAADLVLFAVKSLRQVPSAIRLYPSEVFRQAGILIRSSAWVVLFIMFVFGFLLTLQMTIPFVNAGIDSYMGNAPALVSRGLFQIVFAWIMAAKIGCGIVAELGAMRINDEIDAMEVMGIRSVVYLVSTRIAATVLVVPFLWFVSLAVAYIASYLVAVPLVEVTSHGAFVYILFLFQNMFDFVIWVLWALVYGVVIVLVACYFGFTAKGGPVGVGQNTAWSMLVNIVLISMLAMSINQLFYGNNPNFPIGN